MKNKTELYKLFMQSRFSSLKQESYFWAYENCLTQYKNKNITFVEIGVLHGGSLFMWREFFGPNARIIGVEFNPAAKRLEEHGFEIFIGDQSSDDFWNDFFIKVPEVDIVLDDGGHTNAQQIKTSERCIPKIRNGGMLIIEDTHTSYDSQYGNPSKYSFMNYSKRAIDNINSRVSVMDKLPTIHQQSVSHMTFYQSIVCFHIDKEKCFESHTIDNNGSSSDEISEMWNIHGSSVGSSEKLRQSLSQKFKLFIPKSFSKLANKLFNFYREGAFRLANRKLKKYFGNLKFPRYKI